jgi:hypothetical protein
VVPSRGFNGQGIVIFYVPSVPQIKLLNGNYIKMRTSDLVFVIVSDKYFL